jgi:serine/threonine protein kinase
MTTLSINLQDRELSRIEGDAVVQDDASTDFEDIRTTPKHRRSHDMETPQHLSRKGWPPTIIQDVACPRHPSDPCILRVSTTKNGMSTQASEKQRQRGLKELGITYTLSKLDPPITPRLEEGQISQASPYQLSMVLEKYGIDLRLFIRRGHNTDWGRLVFNIWNLIMRVARRGIFHGDIKPSNIVVKIDPANGLPEARLIDFDPKFMSTFEDDKTILESNLGGNESQLSALYAASMMMLLLGHFRDIHHNELVENTIAALKKFEFFIPAGMDILDSKFGRVLVRHLRHYKLGKSVPTDSRNDVLKRFWNVLRDMIKIQKHPTARPTYNGHGRYFQTSWITSFQTPPSLSRSTIEKLKTMKIEYNTIYSQIQAAKRNKEAAKRDKEADAKRGATRSRSR